MNMIRSNLIARAHSIVAMANDAETPVMTLQQVVNLATEYEDARQAMLALRSNKLGPAPRSETPATLWDEFCKDEGLAPGHTFPTLFHGE